MLGKVINAVVALSGKVDPSLQKSITGVQKSLGKLGKIAGGGAVAGVAAIAGGLTYAAKQATEYQSAFAKTTTLLSGSQKDIQAVSDDIVKLSNATGVAASDLTDTVYQAMSAGVDQADAVNFAGTASKLAAAGFTDASSAVDVLTTTLNAYGKQSGLTAESVSDMLLTTQNLGKTSVNELGSSLGKVIPTASMFGVNMKQLSSAYVATTKNGIATAESTTYINSMMNELGKNGTKASIALKKSTGKTFKQLMDGGADLTDVIGALQKEADKSGLTMADMFGSAEAGKAAAVLSAHANDFKDAMSAMGETGATEEAYEKMTGTVSSQINKIKNSVTNLGISVGSKILPYISKGLEKIVPIMQNLGDKVTPIVDSAISYIKPFIARLVPVFKTVGKEITKALPAFRQLGQSIMPVISTILNTVFSVVGKLLPIITKIAMAVIPMVAARIQAFTPVIQTICSFVETLAGMIADLATRLMPSFKTMWETLLPIMQFAGKVINTILIGAFQLLTPILQGVISLIAALAQKIAGAFQGLAGIITPPMNAVIALVNKAIAGINALSIDIPKGIPIVGGKHIGFNIPQIPMLATGGFTDGVSIAGEAGQEAVISFDPAYRNKNLSYWAEAGQRLGVDDSLLDLMTAGGNSHTINLGGVNFSPRVSINGSGTNIKQDLIKALKQEEGEFMDMLEEFIAWKEAESYG
jgi:TP901 family phage tail tape measure protein